jgi:hypothetical protein
MPAAIGWPLATTNTVIIPVTGDTVSATGSVTMTTAGTTVGGTGIEMMTTTGSTGRNWDHDHEDR